eukprot:8847234-Pyramimonas_sp.AAC.2
MGWCGAAWTYCAAPWGWTLTGRTRARRAVSTAAAPPRAPATTRAAPASCARRHVPGNPKILKRLQGGW